MKKRFFAIIVAAVCTLFVPTQKAMAQNFEWGFRDGISFSSLIGIDNTLPLAELYVGIVGNYFFNDNWGFGVDFTLAEQGAYCMPNNDDVAINYQYTYLNIPLLGHYQFSLGNSQVVRFSAGVQLGMFLLGKAEYTAPSISDDGFVTGSEWLPSESFHPYDLGVSLGAQWFLWSDLAIEVRYTLGITQTHNGISTTLNDNYHISVPDNRNSVFQIGTAYLF
ncbi:MAG: PorT family protein [Tidjanibacter sp.]|nr:PorT family protein [Tidjanibacter sp.]